MNNPIALLGVPSALGLHQGAQGVAQAPRVLLPMLHSLLISDHDRNYGIMEVPSPSWLWQCGIANAQQLIALTNTLCSKVGKILDKDQFPLLIGGDCTIAWGALAALQERGRYGLIYLDGHADFYPPSLAENGQAADMALAIATHRVNGELLPAYFGSALVNPCDVMLVGYRDEHEILATGADGNPQLSGIRCVPCWYYRRGFGETAVDTPERMAQSFEKYDTGYLCNPERQGFWLHLDVDVLQLADMPAIDYQLPEGLSLVELGLLLEKIFMTKRIVGMDVTIYNPNLDSGYVAAKKIVELIEKTVSYPW